jgi:signal transduction histidine kinase/ligand-binding sensor domain-containing protein
MIKKLASTLILILLLITLSAQESYVFKHLSSDDGLSHNTIFSIYKDKYGFMWFGTASGLNKYDGVNFTVYYNNPKDSTSICSDHIVTICEDSYGNLWFGGDYYGLSRYDRKQDIFENYTYIPNKPGGLSSNNIRCVFEDSRKNLWIATSGGGINLYDRKTNSFKYFLSDKNSPNSIGSNYITSIAEDKSGNIWFMSSEIMLCKYSPQNEKFTNFRYNHKYNLNLNTELSYKIYIDSDDDIWLTSEIGFFNFNPQTNAFTLYNKSGPGPRLNVNMTTTITEYKKGILFILTDHGGINILNKQTGEISYLLKSKTNQSSLVNNQLYSIFKTNQGQIWIGSYFGGLSILDQGNIKFQQLQNLVVNNNGNDPSNSVLTICEDANGEIWIGYDGQGILIYNPKTGNLLNIGQYATNGNILNDKAITDLAKDKENNIWIATYLFGIYKFDWKTKKISPFDYGFGTENYNSEKSIRSIALDNFNNLYIGTMSWGLICYNLKDKSYKRIRSGTDDKSLDGDAITKILTQDHKVWLGLYTGLNLLDAQSGKITRFPYNQNNNLSQIGNMVNDIYSDNKNNIWLGSDQGLFLYSPEKNGFLHVLNRQQINAKNVIGILADNNQNLWLSTDNGVVKYNLENKTIECFTVKVGLLGKVFSLHSAAKDSKGYFYFGGNKGLNLFKPETIKKDTIPPPIFITGLKISHGFINHKNNPKILKEHINFADSINLTYKENNFSIEFAALSFTNPSLNQFAYKLEGFENNWNQIGTKNEVTFTNLDPGEYTLWVKGSNSDGTWNEKGTSIKIYISPPFWKTLWFKTLVVIFIILLLLSIYYIRLRQIKSYNKILEKKVDERTKELNSKKEQLEIQTELLTEINVLLEEKKLQVEEQSIKLVAQRDELFELNNIKDKVFSIVGHDLRGPIGSLLGLSELLLEKYQEFNDEQKQNTIKIIYESHQSIFNLLENLLNWSRAQRGMIEFKPQNYNLEKLISENIKVYENQIHNKNILLQTEFEKAPYFMTLDVDLLNIVVRNLLNNAIKFTPKNGHIITGFSATGNKVKVWVKDNGLGIEPENIEKLFCENANFSTIGTNNEKGTGLGLILCKEFVEMHSGEIWAESQTGEGTSFYFTIPL